MRIAPLLPVTILAGVLTLPYAAPVVCTVINPTMTVEEMAARHAEVAVDGRDGPAMCDFAECATAPVAPTVNLADVPDERAAVSLDVTGPAQSVFGDPRPPLTPPPQA